MALALDHKRHDVEALPDGAIDVAFLNGAVRLTEQDEWAQLLRRKARVVVAFGACAHLGGVVGLGNLVRAGSRSSTPPTGCRRRSRTRTRCSRGNG